MPQIKGVCVPPICFSLLHNIVGAKMVVGVLQANGAYAIDKNMTAALPAPLGQPLIAKFNAHRAKFRPLVTQKCDGCGCAAIGPVQGVPVTIPDAEIDTFAFPNQTDGLAHVMVTGITGRIRFGLCVAAGTHVFEVEPNGKRRELIPDSKPPYIEQPDDPH
jgi:hypothetical protein